ncbi:MAG: ABC transporter substrate-binding protein [Sporichthyaceae bacterium]
MPVAAAATGPVARTGPLGIVATARPLTHEHPRRKRVAVPPTVAARPAAAAPCPSGIPPLKLGQVGAFSGVAGPLTASGRVGLAVWAKAVNASGGVACRRVEIYSVDDGADPGRTAAAVSDLVRSKGVVALVGTFAELTQPSLQSAAERLKVPVVGGALVTYEWNRSPYLFPQGASLTSQAFALARQAVQDGKGRAGILYCVESPTCTSVGRELGGEVGKRAGLDVVYSAPVSIIATDYTAQCQNAKTAGAQWLALAWDGSSFARLVRSCAALGYRPTIITGSFVLGPVGAADPGIRRNGVLTVNVTAPWMLSDTPGQRAYQAAMKAHASAVPLDSGSLLAWTSGRLVEAAAARLSDRAGPLASADLVAALGRMEGETLGGLTPPLRFVSGKPAPDAKCVFYTRLSEDGWSAPRGSRAVCP